MVYRIVAIPMTLSDLQGHSPTACLFNWQCVAGSRYKCDSVAHSSKTAKKYFGWTPPRTLYRYRQLHVKN